MSYKYGWLGVPNQIGAINSNQSIIYKLCVKLPTNLLILFTKLRWPIPSIYRVKLKI